jgi:phosphoribosylaminoimidazolecarboxamide formyltransferase/IMP cyclohydrolase
VTTDALAERAPASIAETARIAVLVSGEGSNLRALNRAMSGRPARDIALVVADRECRGAEFAAASGLATRVIRPADFADADAWDAALAEALLTAEVELLVLAGFMRRIGPRVLAAYPGRILNVHPSLLPAFPGAHAVRDALAAGVRTTGVTIHFVDEVLDGGPILAQEAVPVLPGDDSERLIARLHAVEHRLLPQCVALVLADAVHVDGRAVTIDPVAAAGIPARRRALLSTSDKRGLVEFGTALARLAYELVSTGGTARALRDAGLDVTDVASVTGQPEMLDGRVKTLHPRIEAGVLADLRRTDHRAQLALAAIEPFDIVAVNLYPFPEAAARPGVGVDELIEEIDIGGPTLVRAAAKNHASVAIVTAPDDYPAIVAEIEERGHVTEATRRVLAAAAFRRTADYDALISRVLPARLGVAPDADAATADPFPETVTMQLDRAQMLRYGENPHQRAALYTLRGQPADSGPFARGADVVQGKPLSYNNLLDASAAAAIARDLVAPGCVIVKHANPCGAAEAADLVDAWRAALAGDPVSAFGGVVAFNRPVNARLARELTGLFLEVVIAPEIDADARDVLAAKPNLRVLIDPNLASPPRPSIEYRTAGGGVLASESDVAVDDSSGWHAVTARQPSEREREDLEFAWRIGRHVKSNAIVLVRDRSVVGVGAGQMSRVDSAKIAVAKAGPDRARGAVCASDAFFPFPDALEICAAAGVTAFAHPGGSQRDAEVIAAADAAGVSLLATGVRHFRH